MSGGEAEVKVDVFVDAEGFTNVTVEAELTRVFVIEGEVFVATLLHEVRCSATPAERVGLNDDAIIDEGPNGFVVFLGDDDVEVLDGDFVVFHKAYSF